MNVPLPPTPPQGSVQVATSVPHGAVYGEGTSSFLPGQTIYFRVLPASSTGEVQVKIGGQTFTASTSKALPEGFEGRAIVRNAGPPLVLELLEGSPQVRTEPVRMPMLTGKESFPQGPSIPKESLERWNADLTARIASARGSTPEQVREGIVLARLVVGAFMMRNGSGPILKRLDGGDVRPPSRNEEAGRPEGGGDGHSVGVDGKVASRSESPESRDAPQGLARFAGKSMLPEDIAARSRDVSMMGRGRPVDDAISTRPGTAPAKSGSVTVPTAPGAARAMALGGEYSTTSPNRNSAVRRGESPGVTEANTLLGSDGTAPIRLRPSMLSPIEMQLSSDDPPVVPSTPMIAEGGARPVSSSPGKISDAVAVGPNKTDPSLGGPSGRGVGSTSVTLDSIVRPDRSLDMRKGASTSGVGGGGIDPGRGGNTLVPAPVARSGQTVPERAVESGRVEFRSAVPTQDAGFSPVGSERGIDAKTDGPRRPNLPSSSPMIRFTEEPSSSAIPSRDIVQGSVTGGGSIDGKTILFTETTSVPRTVGDGLIGDRLATPASIQRESRTAVPDQGSSGTPVSTKSSGLGRGDGWVSGAPTSRDVEKMLDPLLHPVHDDRSVSGQEEAVTHQSVGRASVRAGSSDVGVGRGSASPAVPSAEIPNASNAGKAGVGGRIAVRGAKEAVLPDGPANSAVQSPEASFRDSSVASAVAPSFAATASVQTDTFVQPPSRFATETPFWFFVPFPGARSPVFFPGQRRSELGEAEPSWNLFMRIPDLGAVAVRFQRRNGAWSVSLSAEDDKFAQALRHDAQHFSGTLKSHGMRVRDVSVKKVPKGASEAEVSARMSVDLGIPLVERKA